MEATQQHTKFMMAISTPGHTIIWSFLVYFERETNNYL
jgi:hypothetical protein